MKTKMVAYFALVSIIACNNTHGAYQNAHEAAHAAQDSARQAQQALKEAQQFSRDAEKFARRNESGRKNQQFQLAQNYSRLQLQVHGAETRLDGSDTEFNCVIGSIASLENDHEKMATELAALKNPRANNSGSNDDTNTKINCIVGSVAALENENADLKKALAVQNARIDTIANRQKWGGVWGLVLSGVTAISFWR